MPHSVLCYMHKKPLPILYPFLREVLFLKDFFLILDFFHQLDSKKFLLKQSLLENQKPSLLDTLLFFDLEHIPIFVYTNNLRIKWKLIHKVGANYIAFIFAFTYLGRITREEFSSVEYNLLFSIIIGAFALRVLHFFRTRNEDKELQKSYKV